MKIPKSGDFHELIDFCGVLSARGLHGARVLMMLMEGSSTIS